MDIRDLLVNDYGLLRVKSIRNAYWCREISHNQALKYCVEWKNSPEYLAYKRLYEYILCDLNGVEHVFTTRQYEYLLTKACKRGNDIYQDITSEKFKSFSEVKDKIYFNEDRRCVTPLLFCVLTYGKRRCVKCGKHYSEKLKICPSCECCYYDDITPDEAWKNIGSEYNLFRSNLIKNYGKVSVFRTWESTDKHYPHINVLVYFHKHDFEVFEHIATKGKSKGKKTFRLSFAEKKKLSKYWHSFSDISGCANLKHAVKEISKYITEDLCSGSKKGNLTIALLTLYNKQAYSISRDFGKVVCGIETDLSEPEFNNQLCNSNFLNEKWEFVGILSGDLMNISPEIREIRLKKPPPELKRMLVEEEMRWLDKKSYGNAEVLSLV